MIPENIFIPIIANMKNIKSIRDPTLDIDGRITRRESTRTLSFLDVLISLNTLNILIALIIVMIVITPEDPSVTISLIKMEISAIITMKKSNRFQF